MKNHLKRIAAPRTWILDRKANTFIVRPNPGAHAFEAGLALSFILRDILKIAPTSAEVQKILHNKEVLVDGKRRKDHRFIVGLFDVLTIPGLKKNFRVELDQKGRLVVNEISAEESKLKVSKVTGKTILPKGRVQFNLYDGKNIIAKPENASKVKVGDSLVLELPKLTVKGVLPLKPGALVFLTKGKHAGATGQLKEIKGEEALYSAEGKDVETAKEYLFVIGDEKKAVIEIKK